MQKQKQLDVYQSAIKKEQDDVVLAYMPALRAMAYRLKERLPASVDVNDLIGCGVEEMVKLSRSYDKSQNDSFWGYARKRVYGSMLDYLRKLDTMSRTDRALLKSINNVIDEYFNEFEDEPSDEYISQKLNVELTKVSEIRDGAMITSVLSIDDQLDITSGENTENRIETEDLIERIERVLSQFSERDQLLIQLYYYEELNLKEISEVMNISESRVSQIHKRLMVKLRESLGV